MVSVSAIHQHESGIDNTYVQGFPVKNPPASTVDVRDVSSIPGSGRSPGGGHGNPLQYACTEHPHGQRSLAATVHKVAESRT